MMAESLSDTPLDMAAPEPAPPKRRPSLTDQTMTGLAWQFGGAGVELVARIVVMIILARLLQPAEFGVASAATIVLSVTQIFAQLGVGQAIVQAPGLTSTHIRSGFAFSLWSGIGFAALIVIGAPAVAALFKMPPLQSVVSLLSVAFLLTGPSIVSIALMQRARRYRTIAAIDAASFVFGYAAMGVTLALLHFGLWALIFAQLAQAAIRSVTFVLLQGHEKSLLFKWKALSQLLTAGTGYSIGQIGNFLALNGDNFSVGRWMGASSLGIYGRAYQFLSIPSNLFGTVVDKVLFPAMAHVQNDPVRLSRAFLRSLAAVALVTLPATVAMVILAPELVATVLGGKWSNMVEPFQILVATLMFRTSYKMSDSLARATGAVYRRAWRQWAYAAAVVIGSFLGSRLGLSAVALGVGVAIVLNFVLMTQLALNITRVSWREVIVLHLRCLAAAAPIGAAVLLSAVVCRSASFKPYLVLLISLTVAALATAATAILAKPVYGEEGRWIINLIVERLRGALGLVSRLTRGRRQTTAARDLTR